MAKKASPKGDRPKAKKDKNKGSAGKSERKSERRSAKSQSPSGGGAADALFKLAEHPIIADLIAVGATAAVAAIVKSKTDSNGRSSSRGVKDAGKAAAAAIGARLMDEFKAVKQSAEASAKTKG